MRPIGGGLASMVQFYDFPTVHSLGTGIQLPAPYEHREIDSTAKACVQTFDNRSNYGHSITTLWINISISESQQEPDRGTDAFTG